MTTELAELILWLNAAGLSVFVALLPLMWPSIVKPVRRWRQEVAYASYALHRQYTLDRLVADDAHRFDARTRTTQRHIIAYGELPWYCEPKAVA